MIYYEPVKSNSCHENHSRACRLILLWSVCLKIFLYRQIMFAFFNVSSFPVRARDTFRKSECKYDRLYCWLNHCWWVFDLSVSKFYANVPTFYWFLSFQCVSDPCSARKNLVFLFLKITTEHVSSLPKNINQVVFE